MKTGRSLEPTVAADLGQQILGTLERMGLDARAARTSLDLDAPEDARIPGGRLLALLEQAEQELRDPLIGLHLGERFQPAGLVPCLASSAADLGSALEYVARFGALAASGFALRVEERSETVCVSIQLRPARRRSLAQATDFTAIALRRLLDDASGVRLALHSVSLDHPPLGPEGEYVRAFGCPVRFGGGVSAVLCLPRVAMRAATSRGNPRLERALSELARKELCAWSPKATDRVSYELEQALEQRRPLPGLVELALRMQTSPRTLHRRLRAQGASLRQLREHARARFAKNLLADTALRLAEVAERVGFGDLASFDRAFRRWAGTTPTAHRDRLATRERRSSP